MKLLYAARMCCPNLNVPVQRLATQVTKWSAEADRRLLRLYQYVKFAVDWVLTGSLSVQDFNHLVLRAWPDADLCGDACSVGDGAVGVVAGRSDDHLTPSTYQQSHTHDRGVLAQHVAEPAAIGRFASR